MAEDTTSVNDFMKARDPVTATVRALQTANRLESLKRRGGAMPPVSEKAAQVAWRDAGQLLLEHMDGFVTRARDDQPQLARYLADWFWNAREVEDETTASEVFEQFDRKCKEKGAINVQEQFNNQLANNIETIQGDTAPQKLLEG